MRRLFHKLFHRHSYVAVLRRARLYTKSGQFEPVQVFIGYRCRCGEVGYEVPA